MRNYQVNIISIQTDSSSEYREGKASIFFVNYICTYYTYICSFTEIALLFISWNATTVQLNQDDYLKESRKTITKMCLRYTSLYYPISGFIPNQLLIFLQTPVKWFPRKLSTVEIFKSISTKLQVWKLPFCYSWKLISSCLREMACPSNFHIFFKMEHPGFYVKYPKKMTQNTWKHFY